MIYGKMCVVLMVVLPAIFAATDYCRPKLCKEEPHIACKNNGKFAASCVKPEIIKITPELKEKILDQHNSLRNEIAKGYKGFLPATRMATMVWDDELAKLAVLNVNQCKLKHDKCHNTEKFLTSGQNLATKSWGGIDFTVAEVTTNQIQSWFDEFKDCPKSVIKSFVPSNNGKKYGHFTAMVRDKSTHVGCAIIRYKTGSMLTQGLACNYAATNLKLLPIYAEGKTASKCASGTDKKYTALCSTKEKY